MIGAIAGAVGLALAGRRSIRTRYRPDPWALPEWLVVVSGVIPAATLVYAGIATPAALGGPTAPPAWPGLPLLPAVAILLAAIAGVVTPPPPGGAIVRALPEARTARTAEEVAA